MEKIVRDREPASPDRAAHAKQVLDEVLADVAYWTEDFKLMKANRKFARGLQWPGMSRKDLHDPDRPYVANITMRHLKQRTAATYARNPKFTWRRSKRLYHQVWDGTASMLQNAVMMTQPAPAQVDPATGQEIPAGPPPPPNPIAEMIIQEAMAYAEQSRLYEKGGETLTILYEHAIREQIPPTKKMMKRMVLMAGTDGVGYVKQVFQRLMAPAPEIETQIRDARSQLEAINRISQDLQDGEIDQDDAEVSRLKLLLEQLEGAEKILLREGLVLSYPDATNIIPDRDMISIVDFLGCRRVSERYYLSPDRVKEVYGIELTDFRAYRPDDPKNKTGNAASYTARSGEAKDGDKACVFEVYDQADGLVYTVADGFDDFLRPPAPPFPWTERFWPWFSFVPNALHDPDNPMPPSDVELVQPMQQEINRSGESLRDHRHAARPGHVVAGSVGEEDRIKLRGRIAHDVVPLNGMQPGDDVKAYLQAFPASPIDPNLYDTGPAMQDYLRSAGSQEANIGPTSGATATESSIAESSRQSVDDSSIDELDDMLTEMARAGGQIFLKNLTAETVKKIAGPGAVWLPEIIEDAADEVYLEVEAGSSGRKNQAHEIQVRTQMWPILSALPGISPERIAKDTLNVMDSRLNLEDWIEPGALSIVAMNGQLQAAANRGPESDPNAQGPAGRSNAPQREAPGQQGPQPAPPPATV